MKTWILVADASKATIYSTFKATLFAGENAKLSLISQHEHPQSRKTDRELVTDKQGHFGNGTFVEQTDPKRHEEDNFAKELTKIINKAHFDGQFKELIFIAPPTFMGMLNKHIENDAKKLISLSIEKDYTKLSEDELIKHIQPHL